MLKMEVDMVMKLIQLMASRMDTSIVYYFQSRTCLRSKRNLAILAGPDFSAGLKKERSSSVFFFVLLRIPALWTPIEMN